MDLINHHDLLKDAQLKSILYDFDLDIYYQPHINNMQKLWLSVYGQIDDAVAALLYLIRENVIPFPFTYQYSQPCLKMFENIIKYQPQILYGRYKSNHHDKFQGQYVRVKSGFNLHDSIDGITDLFIENIRIKGRKSYAKQSTFECWIADDCLSSVIKTLLTNSQFANLTPKDFREAIYFHNPEPGLFKISACKGILEVLYSHSIPKRLKWLDFSAGWGDRLICAIACQFDYVGFDPNIELYPGHQNIIQTFSEKDPNEILYLSRPRHKIYYQPFEDVDIDLLIIDEGLFDICFTSPPYFDLEIYSDAETQSIARYPQFDDWLTNFLFVALEKAWSALKVNGLLVIHIEDIKDGQIVGPMKDYVKDHLKGSEYLGMIGIEGEIGKVRPVWVWRKMR